MFPGLIILEKLFVVLLNWFVTNAAKRKALKQAFDKIFKKTNSDSKVSSDLHDEVEKLKNDWNKK